MKSEQTKENIIRQTIELIEECDGDISLITIRKIAQRAQIGVGLINHYFGSKEHLIEICVQQIIKGVVYSFKLKNCDGKTPKEVTKYVARHVMDFLMENRQISKLSILGDLNSPEAKDNSISTAFAFAHCMSGGIDPTTQIKKAFVLVSLLQESFLRRDILMENIGVDFYNKNQRDDYINDMINMIMRD